MSETPSKRIRLNDSVKTDSFVEIENAFKTNLLTYYYKNTKRYVSIETFLFDVKPEIAFLLSRETKRFGPIKFNLILESTYEKPNFGTEDFCFKTKCKNVYSGSDFINVIEQCIQKLLLEEHDFTSKGSGWTFSSVDNILLRISNYNPLFGSTYIPLPKHVADKKAVINPKNKDDKCFMWALLSRYVEGPSKERVNSRYTRMINRYDFSMLEFPTPIHQIRKFSKANNITVNVYEIDDKGLISPVLIDDNVHATEHFDLLLLTSTDVASHYCYISNFERLVRQQLTKRERKIIVCRRCFTFYYKDRDGEEKMKKHEDFCLRNNPARVVLPELYEDGTPPALKFKNYQNTLPVPIVIYADFECLLKPTVGYLPKPTASYTIQTELHVPMSYCLYFVTHTSCPDDIRQMIPDGPVLYRGPEADAHFTKTLHDIVKPIDDRLKLNEMMIFSREDEELFLSKTSCEMCSTEFDSKNPAVRDHDHITGKYRAALCRKCNFFRRNQSFIPVFIHNSSNYDSHFIVRQLGYDTKEVTVIPNTTEKYISFSKKITNRMTIRFLDSYRFMASSLDSLVKNLPSEKLHHTRKQYKEADLPFVSIKGIYPYEYTSEWYVLEESSLPPKEKFYSKLNGCGVSDEEYEHAKSVWDHFKIETLGQYSDLYLKTDVLLLADVFENFRQLCLEEYKLDCAHYYTAPGFAFDAMLYKTGVRLELITESDIYMFLENGIRGGITTCVKKHAKANNPLVEGYDPNVKSCYLAYIDANNLYGWAMSKCLPYAKFEWLPENEIKVEDIVERISYSNDDDPWGYVLEVDVAYPKELHDWHNDLPFLAEVGIPPKSKDKKLLTTLQDKKHYICHYVILKQAMARGLRVTAVHRVLRFAQRAWLKPYIDMNTENRKRAANQFEKDFFKLMNNSVFGKSMENVRNRMKIELVTDVKRLMKLIRKPTFLDRIIYAESLCAVQMMQNVIYLNKPIYVGLAVLELSKKLMYDFHYEKMKGRYGSNIKLLYMDTDSFFYEIYTDDFYSDLIGPAMGGYFDTSDYPVDHKCYSVENKKVLGKFKDECNGVPIAEFVGLRAKMYAFRAENAVPGVTDDDGIVKKLKGVKKSVVKYQIGFDDFMKCLEEPSTAVYRDIISFSSKDHVIHTVASSKLSLHNYDDKRVSIDKENTLAHGHYKIIDLPVYEDSEDSD